MQCGTLRRRTIVSLVVAAALVTGTRAASAQHLLVVNKSAGTLSIVDPIVGRQLATVPTGFGPHEVAVSPDGKKAYVTDYGSGQRPGHTVTILDVEARRSLGVIELGEHTRPHGIAAAADGTVWVTTEGSQHLLQLDAARRVVLRALPTGQQVTHMVALAERAERAYTANIGSGTVTVVDVAAGRVVTHLSAGAGAEGIDVSPDGRKVYVTSREAGTLAEIDVAGDSVVRTLAVGDFPIRVRVRPDGHEALVSNARGNEVVAVDLTAWQVVRRLPVGAMPVGILIAPDNRTAFVANTQDDRIAVIDLTEWRRAGEIAAGDEPDGMAWVPR